MGPHDEETEHYLEEFQPQAVRKLQIVAQAGTSLWKRVAAAAAIVVCVGGALWFSRHEFKRSQVGANRASMLTVADKRQPRSTLSLTVIALEDGKKFETLLTDESRISLPDFREEQSTLKILAKD